MSSGKGWVYKIVPEEDDLGVGYSAEDMVLLANGVGTVCIWEGYWEQHSLPIVEMGWGVLPKYQGRGFATQAVRLLLQLVEQDSDRRWGTVIHAFTSLDNGPSNSLCRRCNFRCMGESAVDYDGRPLVTNHYEYDVMYS